MLCFWELSSPFPHPTPKPPDIFDPQLIEFMHAELVDMED